MKRRDAFRLAAGVSLVGMAGVGLPTSRAAETMGQKEFLFWLDDRDRSAVRTVAEQILKEIDAGSGMPAICRGLPACRRRDPRPLFERHGVLRSHPLEPGITGGREGTGSPGCRRRIPHAAQSPRGEYVIAIYDAVFSGAPDLLYTEQVTLSREPGVASSPWTFVEYYVNSKPFYKY